MGTHASAEEEWHKSGTPPDTAPIQSLLRREEAGAQSTHLTHLSILEETSKLLAEAGLDQQQVLRTITRQVATLDVDLCVIRLLSDDGKWLVPAAAYHPDPSIKSLLDDVLAVPQAAGDGLQGHVVATGEAILIPSLAAEDIRAITRQHWWAYLERVGIHSILVVPLRARGRVIGGLGLFRSRPGRPYTYEDQVLAQELADRAALAIDNTQLYERLCEREQQLQDLVGRLLLSQEEERRRVAYDVHDSLAQVAASAHQHLQAFAFQNQQMSPDARVQLNRCLELSRQTIREARKVIANLRPTALDDFGLAAAIRLEVEHLASEGWDVAFEDRLGERRLLAAVETALFRITQEALNNIDKHAGTRQAQISLVGSDGGVILRVEDLGCGFDLKEIDSEQTPGQHVGLAGIRERVAILGGVCVIESHPGEGTVIEVDIPLFGHG